MRLSDKIREALLDENVKYRVNEVNHKTCSIDNCQLKVLSKGYCNAHYIRNKDGLDMNKPVRVRKHKANTCMECDRSITSKGGYNRCSRHFKRFRARLIKSEIVAYLGGKCKRCENIYPDCAFDLHHLSSEDKDMNVSTAILNSSFEAIEAEVNKCILLCANCHRIHHNEGNEDERYDN